MNDQGRRISDWKGVAAYFGRDERTVRRWERQRGLPVHRMPGGSRSLIFAYERELEAWLHGAGGAVAGPAPQAEYLPPADGGAKRPQGSRIGSALSYRAMLALVAVLSVVTIAAYVSLAWRGEREPGGGYVPPAEIHDIYLRATYHLGTRQESGLRRAIADLTDITRQEPEFAAAFAALAEAYNIVSQYTLMPADEAYPLAKQAAERAIALDPNLAQAHAALAFNAFYWQRDFARSRALFERAVALDPGSAQTRHWYALTRMMAGEFDLSLREIAEAQRLNPESRAIMANKALIQFHAGLVREALATLHQLAENEPRLRSPAEYLATIHLDQRDYPAFLEEYGKAAEISGNDARKAIAEAAEAGFRQGGAHGLLAAMLEAQKAQHAQKREPAYKLAVTAALLGDADLAIAYLEESIAAGEQDMLGVLIDPAFRSLRDDDRYRRILKTVGFSAPAARG
jgi:Tfp pilus assembly protein PilF